MGGAGGRSKRSRSGHRLLAEKVPVYEQRNRSFSALLGSDGELCPASLEIKHRVGWVSLGKEILPCREMDDASSRPFGCEENGGIEGLLLYSTHLDGLFLNAVWLPINVIAPCAAAMDHHSAPQRTTLRVRK
jgi:hypothetical protein